MRSYEACQYPDARPITTVATAVEPDMLDPVPGRRMDLPGFEPRFVDFPDYIFRITDDIWHKRDLDYIADCYAEDCLIHTQIGSDITPTRTVIAKTAATLQSFPDRRLDADTIIWSRDLNDNGDIFYSSHRITSKMTNDGPSEFGPATRRPVRVTTIADCAARDNRIFEEWLVRDYGAMVLQMGQNPDAVAAQRARDDHAAGVSLHARHASKIDAMDAMDRQTARAETVSEHLVLRLLDRQWSDMSVYDYRVRGDYPYGRSLYGPDQIMAERKAWLTGLENVRFRADHICEVPFLGAAVDVALRWSMSADHVGAGHYGAPTHETLYVLGISHFRILDGIIREEATLWDDIGVKRMVEGIRLGR